MKNDAIIKVDNERISVALTSMESMEELLLEVGTIVDDFEGDVSTPSGRAEVKSMAYKVTRTKTTVDEYRKNLVSKAKKEIKKVDDVGKFARDTLDRYKENVRRPLNEWEERKRYSEETITRLRGTDTREKTVAELEEMLRGVIDFELNGFLEEDLESINKEIRVTYDLIEGAIEKEKVAVAEREELESLRREKAIADEKARTEKIKEDARIEAEAKIKSDLEDAKKREADLVARNEKLEVEHKEAIEALEEKEAEIVEAEEVVEEEPEAVEEFDVSREILNEAYLDIVDCLKNVKPNDDLVKIVVTAIACNEIRHVRIG